MELRQLEYLVAVAEEANFTRAARRVHISQSGISAQIRRLEADLGATLVDRSGRAATLTVAGTAALPHARAALASAAALRQAIDEVNGLIRGHLVVGMVTACTVTPLFDILAAYHLAHPGAAITVVEDHSDRLIERVRSGTADLALIGVAGGPPDDLESLPIVSEDLVAAASPDHPLAARRHTTLQSLSAYPIVCMPTGTGVRAVFDQACAAQGVRPDIAIEVGSSEGDPVMNASLRPHGSPTHHSGVTVSRCSFGVGLFHLLLYAALSQRLQCKSRLIADGAITRLEKGSISQSCPTATPSKSDPAAYGQCGWNSWKVFLVPHQE